jgi:hypothetical protein
MWIIIASILTLILEYFAKLIPFLNSLLYKKIVKKGHVRQVPNKWGIMLIIIASLAFITRTSIAIIDNNKKSPLEYANLNFCTVPNPNFRVNPVTILTNDKDSVRLEMWICNYGNKEAVNLIDTGYFFLTLNDTCFFADSITMSSYSPILTIPAKSGLMNYFTLSSHNKELKAAPNVKFYFYYVLHYSDDTSEPHTFETILKIDWSNLGKEMFEASREEYIRLKKCISRRTFRKEKK